MTGTQLIERIEQTNSQADAIGRRVTTTEGYKGVIVGTFRRRVGLHLLVRWDGYKPGDGTHVIDPATCTVGRRSRAANA
jgi:hypothetical protein